MSREQASSSQARAEAQTTEFVSGTMLWERIADLSREASGPKKVATAYLGEGAGQKIALGKGDQLLVALSEANVKNGTVCPFELRRLKNLGVRVFLDATLHAKVYNFGNAAVVGSANLSSSSGTLHEAALITRDEEQLRQIGEWFERSCTTEVTDAQLDRLEPLFVRRAGSGASKGEHVAAQVWLVGISPTGFPESEEQERLEGEEVAASKIEDASEIEPLRFKEGSKFFREAKVDDLLIQVFKIGRRLEVFHHTVVLGTHLVQDTGALYVYVQASSSPALTWNQFRREMRKAELNLGQDVGTRLLKNPSQISLAKELTGAKLPK